MVGGPLISDDPSRVAIVGADAGATNARNAVAQAEQWVSERARLRTV